MALGISMITPRATTAVACVRASLGASALLALSTSVAAAGFQQRFQLDGVYTQSTDDKSSDIGNSSPGCGSAIVCYVLFQSVPGTQDLLIERVSCLVQIPSGGQFKLAQLISKRTNRATTATSRTEYIQPILTASVNSGEDTYVVNSAVQYPLKAGEAPVLQLFKNVPGVWQANCTISGHIISPPPP